MKPFFEVRFKDKSRKYNEAHFTTRNEAKVFQVTLQKEGIDSEVWKVFKIHKGLETSSLLVEPNLINKDKK